MAEVKTGSGIFLRDHIYAILLQQATVAFNLGDSMTMVIEISTLVTVPLAMRSSLTGF